MKVGIIGPCPPPYGGVTREIENNAHFWKERGIESYLIPIVIPESPTPSPDLKFIDYRKHRSFNSKLFRVLRESVRFPGQDSPVFASYNIALHNIIRELELDILYAHHALLRGLSAVVQSKLSGIPAVVVSYGEAWMVNDFERKRRAMQRYVLRNASQVITTSEYARQRVITMGADTSKSDVVFAGIDTQVYRPDVQGEKLREKYGIGETDILVSSLGLLEKRKGVDVFINSLVHLRSANIKAIIAGKGPDKDYFQSIVAKHNLDFVKFVGFVPEADMPAFYNASDVYVYPPNTIDIAMGQTMKEAMACGVPVVASNIGGIPEAIVDGETGLLFESDNAEDLARKVGRVIDDKRLGERLGAKARNIAVEKFEARTSAEKNIKIFSETIERQRTAKAR